MRNIFSSHSVYEIFILSCQEDGRGFILLGISSPCREVSDDVSLSDLGSSSQGCFTKKIGASLSIRPDITVLVNWV